MIYYILYIRCYVLCVYIYISLFFLRAIGMDCENGCETNLERQVPYP